VADQAAAGGPDWARYYAATVGHEPRPLLRAACELLGAGAGRTAIDLGWATRPYMSFHRPGQARELLEGLEVLRLEETERDGMAVSGHKHWHVYDILARQPLLTGA
jgi:hypothetical protein